MKLEINVIFLHFKNIINCQISNFSQICLFASICLSFRVICLFASSVESVCLSKDRQIFSVDRFYLSVFLDRITTLILLYSFLRRNLKSLYIDHFKATTPFNDNKRDFRRVNKGTLINNV